MTGGPGPAPSGPPMPVLSLSRVAGWRRITLGVRFASWAVLFAGFLAGYAWIRRDWVWIVGDDQNLMMPAINIGHGLVPSLPRTNHRWRSGASIDTTTWSIWRTNPERVSPPHPSNLAA